MCILYTFLCPEKLNEMFREVCPIAILSVEMSVLFVCLFVCFFFFFFFFFFGILVLLHTMLSVPLTVFHTNSFFNAG